MQHHKIFCWWWFLVLVVHSYVILMGAAQRHKQQQQQQQQLSTTFYRETCPSLPWIVGGALSLAVRQEPRVAPAILRLHFHDCFVNGCDASILLDDTPSFKGEKSAIANRNSVRGYEVIDDLKEQVERECPGIVSCADIIALAAREAVAMMGGPMYTVYYGRRDSTTANFRAAGPDNIPAPNATFSQLVDRFKAKGLSQQEMVALSGSHTIGEARCVSFRDRVYNFQGTGRSDPSLGKSLQTSIRKSCPRTSARSDDDSSDDPTGFQSSRTPLDSQSPTRFDTSYYSNLQNNMGLLVTDQLLYSTPGTTRQLVDTYADNSQTFFADFGAAMIKMGNIRPLTGSQGQVRRNCRRVN